MKQQPLAILCSDLHLSLKQPACRADKDWMETQARYLEQLKDLALSGECGQTLESPIPVICAGDIFDRWNAPAELIHFALEHLPDGMICVPGQHDLPNHRIEEMGRSGYGVLAKAGKIIDLYDSRYVQENMVLYPFGWGREISGISEREKTHYRDGSPMRERINIAVIHRYVWLGEETAYPGAPEDSQFASLKKILSTYDAVVIGDNHKGWATHYRNKTAILNCGTFIRRKSDEMDYRPRVGILLSDGTIKSHYLDTSKDKFHENAKDRELGEQALDIKAFIEELESLGEHGLNFREAVERVLQNEDLHPMTKQIVLEALEKDNK